MLVYRRFINSMGIRQDRFHDIDKNSNSCLKMSNLVIALNYFYFTQHILIIPS